MAYTGRPVRQLAVLTSAQIEDKAVATVDIADAAVTATKIAANGLTANTYGAKSIGTASIADAAITAAKISPNTLAANTYGTKSIAGAAIADGAVSSVKIASGTINANNIGTLTSDVTFADSAKALFGTGSDLEIYHDGSNSRINDAGTGNLQLQLGGSTKVEVTSAGIDVTGTTTTDLLATGNTAITGSLQVTGQAYGTVVTAADGATITPNFANGNMFSVTIAGNRTLANPTNGQPGQVGSIFVKQDGTGSRTLSFGSNWHFPAASAPTLTTTGNAVDRIDYVVYAANAVHAIATLDNRNS